MLPNLTTLQNVVLPLRPAVEPLYLRSDRPLFYPQGPEGRGEIELGREQMVDFDSYFNALFESHVARMSAIRTVYLQLKVRGVVALTVCRSSRNLPEQLVVRQTLGSGPDKVVTHVVRVEFVEEPLRGRLYFTLTGLHEKSALEEARWCVASDEIRRDVKIDAILCTFKREKFLKRTVSVVCGAEELGEHLNRVIIVDNACTLKAEDFPDPRVALYPQDNVGGSGGFTRGLIESLSDPRSTHFVFMDDDIEIHPETLFRVVSYLSIMKGEHAIDGGMIDLSRPNKLWETGAVRNPAQPFRMTPLYDGLELGNKEALAIVAEVQYPEYGGWWLFACPKSAPPKVGLPAAMFIHADDIEYSNRLERGGVHGYPIPGIAVWHPPFYAKTPDWMFYYDIRNHLICDSIHPKFTPWQVFRTLTYFLHYDLMRFNYLLPTLLLEGLRDFMAGPEVAFSDPVKKHEHILALTKENASRPDPRELDVADGLHDLPLNQSLLAKALRVVTLNGHWLAEPEQPRDHFRWALPAWFHRWDAIDGSSVAVKNPWVKGVALWDRRPAKFWALWREAARVLPQLLVRYGSLRRMWQEKLPQHTTVEAWRRYLKLEDSPAASARAQTA
jgi:galactofuranosylgalactofuranosylrhamnosyl-N-acetylglucosaminyl-diphospho-decaprenol beta-1,5/1,6-galactofuranosyltransferase